MPDWTHDPPNDSTNYGYRLIRTPPYKVLRCLILSDQMIGTRTHYTKGRTLPCEGLNCQICQEGLPWRWHAYLAVLAGDQKEKCILELTAQAAEQLTPLIKGYGRLRGMEMISERPSKRPNGRVRIAARMNGTPPNTLPEEPDVTLIMMHIWGLDDRQMIDDPAKKPFDAQKIGQLPEDCKQISESASL